MLPKFCAAANEACIKTRPQFTRVGRCLRALDSTPSQASATHPGGHSSPPRKRHQPIWPLPMMLNSEDDRYHDLDDFEISSSMPHGGQPPVMLPSQVCMPPPPAKQQARSKAKAPDSKVNGTSKSSTFSSQVGVSKPFASSSQGSQGGGGGTNNFGGADAMAYAAAMSALRRL